MRRVDRYSRTSRLRKYSSKMKRTVRCRARRATLHTPPDIGRGFVVGGRVFGYRNVDAGGFIDAHGRIHRSHVTRVIELAEAPTVVRAFELAAEGYGVKRIAKTLNAEGAPPCPLWTRRSCPPSRNTP